MRVAQANVDVRFHIAYSAVSWSATATTNDDNDTGDRKKQNNPARTHAFRDNHMHAHILWYDDGDSL